MKNCSRSWNNGGLDQLVREFNKKCVNGCLPVSCTAALDLSTTSVGRLRLLEFSFLEKLVPKSLCCSDLPILGLEVQWKLSKNSVWGRRFIHISISRYSWSVKLCTIKQLQKMPQNLSQSLVVQLKGLWDKVHSFMVCSECSVGGAYISNVRTNDMAEGIFSFAWTILNLEDIQMSNKLRSIFGLGKIHFENFILDYWEVLLLLFRCTPKDSLQEDNIFSSLAKFFQSEEMPSFLPSILKNLTSCPPTSDEVDVLHFLEQVRDHFGCSIIHQQDIRVVKTHQSEGELHYFLQQFGYCSSQTPHVLDVYEILKCMEAYNRGYTIALRGMGFRFRSVVAIADGLASLSGQPSAAVNMYFTPPNSQGLSCHSDDFCLTTYWNERMEDFHPSRLNLPGLYEFIDSWPDSDDGKVLSMLHSIIKVENTESPSNRPIVEWFNI